MREYRTRTGPAHGFAMEEDCIEQKVFGGEAEEAMLSALCSLLSALPCPPPADAIDLIRRTSLVP